MGYDRVRLVEHLITLAHRLGLPTQWREDLEQFEARFKRGESLLSRSWGMLVTQLSILTLDGAQRVAPMAAHAFLYILADPNDNASMMAEWPVTPVSPAALRTADILRDLVPWSEVEPLIEQWVKDREKDARG